MPPVPAEPWPGVKAADTVGPICTQRELFTKEKKLEGSEDCLYLNVYAPETVSRTKPLPVMVFIHGGAFMCGTGSIYTHEYLMEREVILVNFNYRLGALGFLSTGDDVITGNYGLKDMVMALYWVQSNIRAFGGDPDKVTIFGESAGSAAVHLLMLSPLSQGLFHRAIQMSGSALAPWAYDDASTARHKTFKIAESLGCPTETSEELRQCLMLKSADELQGTDDVLKEWMTHPIAPFRPTAEPSGPGAFLDRHPKRILAVANDVPVITGFTSHEGGFLAAPSEYFTAIIEEPGFLEDFDKNYERIAPIVFMSTQLPEAVSKEVFNRVRSFYFNDMGICKATKWQIIDVFTDSYFTHSTLETVKIMKETSKSPVFVYEMAHTGKRSWVLLLGAIEASYGASHIDDLLYLFPLTFIPGEMSPADKTFSAYLIDLFTSFADTGRPTADGSWQEVLHPERAEYMHLSEANSSSMRQDFEHERVNFWYRLPVNVAQVAPDVRAKDEL